MLKSRVTITLIFCFNKITRAKHSIWTHPKFLFQREENLLNQPIVQNIGLDRIQGGLSQKPDSTRTQSRWAAQISCRPILLALLGPLVIAETYSDCGHSWPAPWPRQWPVMLSCYWPRQSSLRPLHSASTCFHPLTSGFPSHTLALTSVGDSFNLATP